MKKTFKAILLLSATILVSSTSYAFCVYNSTIGNDTQYHRHETYIPTEIVVKANGKKFKIDQGDYACKLTGRRDNNDTSVVNVSWVTRNFDTLFNSDKTQPVCQVMVYNKGGYITVKGDHGKYTCNVYRD